MSEQEFERYLKLLGGVLRLDARQRAAIADELRDHFEQRLEALLAEGRSRDEAIAAAIDEFGDAAGLAGKFVALADGRRRRRVLRYTGFATAAVAASIVLLLAMWPENARVRAVGTSVAQGQAESSRNDPPSEASDGDEASAAERRVYAALEKNIDLEFLDTPLTEVIQWLRQKAGVEFEIDKTALEANGVALDVPVTLHQPRIRIRSALNWLTSNHGLSWYVDDDCVVVTTAEASDNVLRTRVYPVRDLLEGGAPGDAAWDSLLALVKRHTCPGREGCWSDDGGVGTAVPLRDGLLVVRQTPRAHEQIAGLLQALRRLGGAPETNPDKRNASVRSLSVPGESPQEREIAARLLDVCQPLEFLDTPLGELVRFLGKQPRFASVLDTMTVEAAGVGPEKQLTFVSRGAATLQTTLARLLRPLELVAIVRDDALCVTSREKADSLLVTRLYPLHDMTADAGPQAAGEWLRIAEMIQATTGVPGPNWGVNGGSGVVDVIPASRAMAVSTTAEVHAQIETLFASLRRARKTPTAGVRPAPNSGTPLGSATVRVFWIVSGKKQAAPANSADDVAVAVRELLVGDMGETIEPFQITTLKDRLFVRAGAAVHERVARMATEELTGLLSVEAP